MGARRMQGGLRRLVGFRLWCAIGRAACRGRRLESAAAGAGLEGLKGDLEGVDDLAGAAGVDGVFTEAMDDGGEGDEDGGAVLDGGQVHAGDFGVDEDTPLAALNVLEVVVIAVVLAFHRRRAATLAAWGLVVVALLIATEVWNWRRHRCIPPRGYRLVHDLPNKPLTGYRLCMILKTKARNLQDQESAGVMVSLEPLGDTSLRLVDSVSTQVSLYVGCQAGMPGGSVRNPAHDDVSEKPTYRYCCPRLAPILRSGVRLVREVQRNRVSPFWKHLS